MLAVTLEIARGLCRLLECLTVHHIIPSQHLLIILSFDKHSLLPHIIVTPHFDTSGVYSLDTLISLHIWTSLGCESCLVLYALFVKYCVYLLFDACAASRRLVTFSFAWIGIVVFGVYCALRHIVLEDVFGDCWYCSCRISA